MIHQLEIVGTGRAYDPVTACGAWKTFDRHYREVHIPLGSRLPGLRRYTVGQDAAAIRGASYYLSSRSLPTI